MEHSKPENQWEKEIPERYLHFLDRHIEDVVEGKTPDFLELNQIASEIAVSHKHLIDVMQQKYGNHPRHFYDAKIIDKAKDLLLNTDDSIAEIARKLTYDPSNFSKFFKKWTGETPGNFRLQNRQI